MDKLLTIGQVAEMLGISTKSVRRWSADRQNDRRFPKPVLLPSPTGARPLRRWRLSDVRRFASLEEE